MQQFYSEIKIRYYIAPNGRPPFITWLEGLKDIRIRGRIKVRIDRLKRGLFGDTRALGGGLEELRIHDGPGYRVYYGRIEAMIVLLLCGGTKARQRNDIERARKYWSDFLETLNDKKKIKEERRL